MYIFRIAAVNIFCKGLFSEPTRVRTGEIPSMPKPPVTSIIAKIFKRGVEVPPDPDARVRIRWKRPANPSAPKLPIETYNLQIGLKDE